MFKKILVPTDGSRLSDSAADAAVAFARETGASLVVLSVAEAYPYPVGAEGGVVPDMSAYEDTLREASQKHVDRILEKARAAGVACEGSVLTAFAAADEIVNTCREKSCDLIWMASHGRTGLNRMLMGSQTQKVLAHAVAPVMVYPMKK